MNMISKKVIFLSLFFMFNSVQIPFANASSSDMYEWNDWVCYVSPFDQHPDNRINLLGSMKKAYVLHVESDGKTLISQDSLRIVKVAKAQNTRAFSLEDGSALSVVIETSWGFNKRPDGRKLTIDGAWHPAIHIKSGKGGIFYKCKAVTIEKD
jgi:hypothetical protein